jgi:hypothetical protein
VKDSGKNVQPLIPPDEVSGDNTGSRSDRILASETDTIVDRGKRFVVTYDGDQMRVGNLVPELREDAARLLQGQNISDSVLREELSLHSVDLRGGDDERRAVLLSPVGTLIEEDRPVLKWKPVEGASSYVVDIVDDGFRPVAQSPHLGSTEWRVTENLKRDATYQWQVTTFKDKERIEGQINPVGWYKIISEKKLDELKRARKKYSSHLELGIYYLREGFLVEAEKEFKALRSKNPNSKLVNQIYRSDRK